MTANQLYFDGKEMTIRAVELPPPQGAQALIHAEYSNISIGTEIAYLKLSKRIGKPAPLLGYSLVGIVEAVGLDAPVKVGQRVLALAAHGSAVLADASLGWLTPVPEELDPAVATLGAIIGVAMHIVQRAQVKLGERAVVYGQGLVGVYVTQLLRRAGAAWIMAVEPDPRRAELANICGADCIANPGNGNLNQMLHDNGIADGVDLVIETAGHTSMFPSALEILRTGGRLVCSSTFLEGLFVPLYPVIVEKELTVIGAHQPKCPLLRSPYYPYSQSENRGWALKLLADKSLKWRELITHRVPWKQAPDFYERIATDRTIIGAVIDWTKEK